MGLQQENEKNPKKVFSLSFETNSMDLQLSKASAFLPKLTWGRRAG